MRLGKRYLIPILLGILMLTSCLLVACDQESSSTRIYQNDQYGYSLRIPKTWTISEKSSGQPTTFRPSHDQMEITVTINSEDVLNKSFSEAKNRGVDVKGMTPLELLVRFNATEQLKSGGEGKRIDWNEHAITTVYLIQAKEWKSWVKTLYILDNSNIYVIVFKVLGYSDSEFEAHRTQINSICKSFRIQGSAVNNLPEGKTIFDF